MDIGKIREGHDWFMGVKRESDGRIADSRRYFLMLIGAEEGKKKEQTHQNEKRTIRLRGRGRLREDHNDSLRT